MKEIHYTVGFLFDRHGHVLLVRKEKPEWQRGLLNGIGGKIEEDETPQACMAREFYEETGFLYDQWEQMGRMENTDISGGVLWRVYIFRAFIDEMPPDVFEFNDVGERIEVHRVDQIQGAIPNLTWIVPLCLDRGVWYSTEV